jgi:hypothetical protein
MAKPITTVVRTIRIYSYRRANPEYVATAQRTAQPLGRSVSGPLVEYDLHCYGITRRVEE